MSILDNLNIDDLASTAADVNEKKTGGGDYTPPPAGMCLLRYVGYVEVGKQKNRPFQGKPKADTNKAWHIFEIHGKNYPVKVLDDGTKIPMRITVKQNISLNERAPYSQLFSIMNWEQKYRSFFQMLGQAFRGKITHSKPDAEGKVFANLVTQSEAGTVINIMAPAGALEDPVTGDINKFDTRADTPAAVSDLRLFLWNATPANHAKMWDNIHIPSAPDAKYDTNVFQGAIRKASNFEGSPIAEYLGANGILNVGKVGDGAAPEDDGLGAPAEPEKVATSQADQDTGMKDLGL